MITQITKADYTDWRKALFLISLLFILIIPAGLYAQTAGHIGTDFWLAFPDNIYTGPGRYIGLYIQSDVPANFTVTTNNPPFIYNSTISPNSPKLVSIPAEIIMTSSEVIEDKAIHVVSDRPITIKGKTPIFWYGDGAGVTDDAYLGLPKTTLGTEYIVLAYQESVIWRGIPGTYYPSEFALIGTEDGTAINITPSCTSINGTQANIPFSIILNQGQTYQYKCGNKTDVTGTIITSDKPIGVLGGNKGAMIPTGYCCADYLMELIYPVNMWGNDYITYPINNGTADLIRILASQDGTTVTIDDGVNPTTAMLNRGQFYEVRGNHRKGNTYNKHTADSCCPVWQEC